MATLTIARAHDASGNPTNGFIAYDDGTVLTTFASDVTCTIAPGNFVVYNKGAAITTISTTVAASPAPTTTTFTVASGKGQFIAANQAIAVGAQNGTVLSVTGDAVVLTAALTTVPTAGQTVSQTLATNAFGAISAAIDLSTDTYANVFLVGRVSDKPDPHTGNLYMTGYHVSVHEAHGQHHAKGSIGRNHHHKHQQTRFNLHDIVFVVSSSDTTPNTAGHCSVGIKTQGGTGKIYYDDNATTYTVADTSASPTTGVSSGSYIVLNTAASSVTFNGVVIAAGAIGFVPATGSDLTTEAAIPLLNLGKLSDVKDPVSLQYWTSGHHPGAHQVHSIHLAAGVGGGTVPSKNASKYQFHDITFTVSKSDVSPNAAGQCSVKWNTGTNAAIVFTDGTASITSLVGANGQANPLTAVPKGNWVVYDTGATTPGFDKVPTSTLGTDPAQTRFLIVGEISEDTDKHTHQYYIENYHPNAHESHGKHKATHSSGRKAHHPHHAHKKHKRKHASDGSGRHTVVTAA